MKIFKNITLIMSLVFLSSAIVGCTSSNDDAIEVTDLNTYIIGSWHSFMMRTKADNITSTLMVSENNHENVEYSDIVFMEDGKADLYSWCPDWGPVEKTVVDKGSYQINGTIVGYTSMYPQIYGGTTIGFNSSSDSDKPIRYVRDVKMFRYDTTNKTLLLKYVRETGDKEYIIDLYFKK